MENAEPPMVQEGRETVLMLTSAIARAVAIEEGRASEEDEDLKHLRSLGAYARISEIGSEAFR